MKDFIYINYDIFVDKIISNYFFVNDDKIIIMKYSGDTKRLDDLVELTNLLYSKGTYVNTFILNNKKEYYTKRNNEYIILLKVNDRQQDVSVDYLNKFNNINNNLVQLDIKNKWKDEIDDLENKITELNKEYNIIQKSFNYYVGMSENAIQLIAEYDLTNLNDISHNICLDTYNVQELNNPFTFVRGNRMFNISLFIKYNFFNGLLDYDLLDEILISITDENDEAILFSSLLYADYYFDYVKDILDLKKNEECLEKYINKIKEYEKLLNYCQKFLKKSKYIKLINWFNE